MELVQIAHIENDFTQKFGVPRQSGLAPHVLSRIVFEPKFADEQALRGIDGFSHLWLIWGFNEAKRKTGSAGNADEAFSADGATWRPTVRPPRLGGNERMGVFATRSPFRPNGLGLSVVRLERVERGSDGSTLVVAGADLMNGTPIYDIKPYIPYADAHPEATGGFTDQEPRRLLNVVIDDALLLRVPEEKREALREVLAQDPRPAYHDDPSRVYVMSFGGQEVSFKVDGSNLSVVDVC